MTHLRPTLAALALAILGSGCVVVTDNPQPTSSPRDTRYVSAPGGPAIDAHFDLIFPGVYCDTSIQWRVTTTDGRDSGMAGCYDYTYSRPWLVRFDYLGGYTRYDMTATAYVGGVACYTASCSAVTESGAVAVIPSCTVSRTC